MIVNAYPPEMTAEEFEVWPDAGGCELIDGKPREKSMGTLSSNIQLSLAILLGPVVQGTGLGKLFDSECMYKCFPSHPRRVRKPDISLVLRDRLPPAGLPDGMFRIR